MSYRVLVAAGWLAASAALYAQTGLAGKWQTDDVPAALEAQKNPPPDGAKGPGGGGRTILLDLTVDASGKISGTVNEIGNPPVLNIETGMITGTTVTWVTQPRGVTWTLELTDDNTLTLTSRAIPARGGGGGAPGAGAPGGGAPGGGGGARGTGGGRGGGRGRGPQQPIVLHRVK